MPSRCTTARRRRAVRGTHPPPAARLSAARKMAPRSDARSAPLAVLLEYGPPVFLLGTVLVVIVLKELGYLNIKY
jgi:hypothetical protein